ncbi:MAG: MarR family transcriptional regulator [Gracilibacteraceae bacterium]|jgi:DNA-binding MarR family transcriptional regulator|nr:MarR family transcriptional regulator [Gracilibacteraceae bacterium]
MNRKAALMLAEKLNKTVTVLNAEKKEARDYGIGFPLYHSEVHLLDTIHLHEGNNGQELAKRLGITKGAVAQIAKKLIDKALIESYQLPGNKKEVYFRLTELGERAVAGHKRHHERMSAGVIEYIDKLGEKDIQTILRFLDTMMNGVTNSESS